LVPLCRKQQLSRHRNTESLIKIRDVHLRVGLLDRESALPHQRIRIHVAPPECAERCARVGVVSPGVEQATVAGMATPGIKTAADMRAFRKGGTSLMGYPFVSAIIQGKVWRQNATSPPKSATRHRKGEEGQNDSLRSRLRDRRHWSGPGKFRPACGQG